MNHVTPDGLLAVDRCERPIRYRDERPDQSAIILQDDCAAEPRATLWIRDTGHDESAVTLDVQRATRLHDALGAFLQNATGTSAWLYGGVKYNLEASWEGRPGTRWEGRWFRYTDKFRLGVPVMVEIVPPGHTSQFVLLADLLDLKPCPDHGGYNSPCPQCILAEDLGEPYGTGFEPRGE